MIKVIEIFYRFKLEIKEISLKSLIPLNPLKGSFLNCCFLAVYCFRWIRGKNQLFKGFLDQTH